jgi:hypothetical protein
VQRTLLSVGAPAVARPRTASRTHLCCGAGYRHGVEQRGARVHGEHAAVDLCTSASHRCSATTKPALRPIEQRKRAARHTTHRMAVRCSRLSRRRCNMHRCNMHRCNMQRAPMQHATTADATRNTTYNTRLATTQPRNTPSDAVLRSHGPHGRGQRRKEPTIRA